MRGRLVRSRAERGVQPLPQRQLLGRGRRWVVRRLPRRHGVLGGCDHADQLQLRHICSSGAAVVVRRLRGGHVPGSRGRDRLRSLYSRVLLQGGRRRAAALPCWHPDECVAGRDEEPGRLHHVRRGELLSGGQRQRDGLRGGDVQRAGGSGQVPQVRGRNLPGPPLRPLLSSPD